MPKRVLKFSPDLHLPLDAVTQAIAFLARRGGGKTYGAGKLAEEMLRVGAQVVVIDPVGNWYGLRIAADGVGKGFDIPVFGGRNGDIPLEPKSGRFVAQYVVERGIPLVLDVSMFRKAQQKEFVADFAEELFELKKANPSALHLIIEESQRFAPQHVFKGGERLLGAIEDLVKLGRNYGIGISLLSQRPQAVNKDCLNQTECLVVLQTNGKQERKAIAEWISEKDIAEGAVNLGDLPHLPVGTAFLWSPQWLGILQRIRIGTKATFNASATPKVGEKRRPPKPLAPGDLERLRTEMKDMVQKAEESDPKHLKMEVARLKAELAKKGKDHVVPTKSPSVQRVIERVPIPVDRKEAHKKVRTLQAIASSLKRLERVKSEIDDFIMVVGDLDGVSSWIWKLTERAAQPAQQAAVVPPARVSRERPTPVEVARTDNGEVQLKAGCRRILAALLQSPNGQMTKPQVGLYMGSKIRGGTFNQYLSALKRHGFIEGSNPYTITSAGRAYIAMHEQPEVPQTLDQLLEAWRPKLKRGARRLLDLVVEAGPAGITRDELASATNVEVGGGTFNQYLSAIKRTGLVVSDRSTGRYNLTESPL